MSRELLLIFGTLGDTLSLKLCIVTLNPIHLVSISSGLRLGLIHSLPCLYLPANQCGEEEFVVGACTNELQKIISMTICCAKNDTKFKLYGS